MSPIDRPSYHRRDFLRAGAGLIGLTLAGRLSAQSPPEVQPLPARLPADSTDGPPVVSARAWAVADGSSGRLLWGSHEADALNMASTTKIMTAWVVLRLAADDPRALEETVTFSERADRTTGSSSRLLAGDRLPVRDLLYGLLLPSGNDASVALAEHFGARCREPGSDAPPEGAFVARMNRTAAELGMRETSYLDPHGLGRNRTSARDLATLGHRAMRDPVFRGYVGTRRHRCAVTAADGRRRTVTWENSNRLLGTEGYDGIKTGTTSAAGCCLVASGRRDDDHLIVVVLGATSNDSRYVDARNLFRWAWRERQNRPG